MVGPDVPGLHCVRRVNPADQANADEVYLARQVSDGVEVAVRIYAKRLVTDRDRARFEHEIDTLKKLIDVPHAMSIRDAGVNAAGHAYVVTDFHPSGSLHDHITAVGRFTPSEVRKIGAKVAGAVGMAHHREIYHRNIKPANVFINGHGEPVLSDFRLLSLVTVDGDLKPPVIKQVRPYAAPEAYLPELMSGAADIYALGATLYAMLAGWAPRTIDPTAISVDGDTLADLPKVPWALMTIVRRAMAHDPKERFADAHEIATALNDLA
jgi:serine/threonine protein kinase